MGLPDIVAVSTLQNSIYAIEAKSTVSNMCYVPSDQIVRCHEILDMFSIYKNAYVVFAFKFAGGMTTKNIRQKLRYWYVITYDWVNIHNIKSVKCSRNGNISHTATEREKKSLFMYDKFESIEPLLVNGFYPQFAPRYRSEI